MSYRTKYGRGGGWCREGELNLSCRETWMPDGVYVLVVVCSDFGFAGIHNSCVQIGWTIVQNVFHPGQGHLVINYLFDSARCLQRSTAQIGSISK